jgi:hypothetical protein
MATFGKLQEVRIFSNEGFGYALMDARPYLTFVGLDAWAIVMELLL